MNRRQLLLRGALLAAMAPVVRAAGVGDFLAEGAGTGAGAGEATPLFVVHDPAYRRSVEFAAALAQRGARTLALEPDALAAWHGVLRTASTQSPSLRITGLTTRTDYLVLRDLARMTGLVPLATRDADARLAVAGVARQRATLIGWVLAPRAKAA